MMRRLLLAFFVFVLLGIVLALVFRDHQGYLLISFNGWQLETSFLYACVALAVGVWLLIIIWRLVAGLVLAPRSIQGFVGRRRRQKAWNSQYAGLEKMAEAHWKQAEGLFKTLARSGKAPGLNYLLSARTAHYRSHLMERDQFLEQASQTTLSSLAVLITRAELQMEAGQTKQAKATLDDILKIAPRHPHALALMAENAAARGDHEKILAMQNDLGKHAALSPDRRRTILNGAYRDELSRQPDVGSLTTVWRQLPRNLRDDDVLLAHYVQCLQQFGSDDDAANLIRNTLKQRWVAPLVLLFGDLNGSDRGAQLATVEQWLKAYGDKPELSLVAGIVCRRNQLWGRARHYLEGLVEDSPDCRSLSELGALYEQLEEPDRARMAYRRALQIKA